MIAIPIPSDHLIPVMPAITGIFDVTKDLKEWVRERGGYCRCIYERGQTQTLAFLPSESIAITFRLRWCRR